MSSKRLRITASLRSASSCGERRRFRMPRRRLPALLIVAPLVALAGCIRNTQAVARQIQSRADLIGGPSALGEIGDYLLGNDQIRVVIQGEGFSRGIGLFGGSLIDADLVRPALSGDVNGGRGQDAFSEMFPAFFMRAMK